MVSIAVPLVTDPAAWTATSFESAADYTVTLTDAERHELLVAVHNIERRGSPGSCPPNSRTPILHCTSWARAWHALSSRCVQDAALWCSADLPRADLSFDEFAAVVWGLNTFFGYPLSQNAQGELLSEVVDASAVEATPRMYRSALELGLHTDVTGMLSLACWNSAKSGGETAAGQRRHYPQ